MLSWTYWIFSVISTSTENHSDLQPCLCTIESCNVIILLIIIKWKRHWFYTEAGQENPYKAVFKILKFASKHKHPLQRSAFTYNDNYILSRLDFAKERYRGPFSTEQVENVKTFFRMLLVLLSMGPVFMLEVTNR